MSQRLLYVMDPMCSWCWGFAPVAEALALQAQEAGAELHIVVGGLRRNVDPLDSSVRDKILGHWEAVQVATGQPFQRDGAMPPGFVYDTEPACRAVVAVRQLEPALAWSMVKQIQHAFYAEGIDVTRAGALVDIAERVGVSRQAFAGRFDSAEARQATEQDFTWVQDLGIAGFPTMLAERNRQLALLTNGYRPLEELSPLLGRWLKRAEHA